LSRFSNHDASPQVRRALKTFLADAPEYERLLPFIKGNIGFVFTNQDLKDIRDKILSNKVAAPARAGAVAPADVWIPAGNTGMEPGKTAFFQALGVPTKIARGTIEITTDLKLVAADTKVGPSEATLLNMLNISPFTSGLGISQVYDQGNTFPADVLDIGEEQLLKAFSSAVTTVAAVSLALNYPTLPSVIHSLVNSYKKVLAVAIETDFSWPEIDELKDRIANPDAYAAAGPAAPAAGPAETKAEEAKEESEKEDSDDEGFGGLLFVPLTFSFWSTLLTASTATKYDALSTVLLGTQFWFESGKGPQDLCPWLHRSAATQFNTLCLMVTPGALLLLTCNCSDLVSCLPRRLWLVPFFLSSSCTPRVDDYTNDQRAF
jgi:large subunit ribosomal protein LP0